MAKVAQALAFMTLSAAYALECFNIDHPAVHILLSLAYLVIAVKYLHDAAESVRN
jgi:hypothetical protein